MHQRLWFSSCSFWCWIFLGHILLSFFASTTSGSSSKITWQKQQPAKKCVEHLSTCDHWRTLQKSQSWTLAIRVYAPVCKCVNCKLSGTCLVWRVQKSCSYANKDFKNETLSFNKRFCVLCLCIKSSTTVAMFDWLVDVYLVEWLYLSLHNLWDSRRWPGRLQNFAFKMESICNLPTSLLLIAWVNMNKYE